MVVPDRHILCIDPPNAAILVTKYITNFSTVLEKINFGFTFMGKTVHNVRQTLQKKLNNYNTLHLLFGLITIYDWLINIAKIKTYSLMKNLKS
jgi:hypothetical protein